MKTWIVVANRTEAKIFYSDPKQNRDVEFINKLENPRGRLKAGDINADRPGAFSPMATGHGSGREAQVSPTERVAQEFVKEIVTHLDAGRTQNQFEELVLIADPHFLGLMRNQMSKELKKLVSREEAKDLAVVTSDELQERLYPQQEDTLGF
jgi:protein required for attachment to host cells